MTIRPLHAFLFSAISAGLLIGCGGSSGSSSKNSNGSIAPNAMAVAVDGGPVAGTIYPNGLFATVTVCVPGTSTCQTIPDVLVDTGSTGLRLVNNLPLTVSLPPFKISGNQIANCVQYVDGSFNWGIVATADVQLGNEKASSVPVQLIGDPTLGGVDSSFPSIPSGCSQVNGAPGTAEDDVASLGANGILGVGNFLQDCGSACATSIPSPAIYYSCPTASTCVGTTVPVNQQLQNPVGMFATDNNGVIIELPSIPSSGQLTTTGTMVFGIGTESNNGLGSATIYAINPTTFGFATTYNGTQYGTGPKMGSFLDSGSNGIFFLDHTTIGQGFADCPSPATGFYCNSTNTSPVAFPVQNQSATGQEVPVTFNIEDTNTLFNTSGKGGAAVAFNDLGGANSGQFDFGLSFFYGRNIYTAFEQRTIPGAGTGPFWAF